MLFETSIRISNFPHVTLQMLKILRWLPDFWNTNAQLLYSINLLVFIMEHECLLSGTDCIQNKLQGHFLVLIGLLEINFSLSYLNHFYIPDVCFYINRIPLHVIGPHEPKIYQKPA